MKNSSVVRFALLMALALGLSSASFARNAKFGSPFPPPPCEEVVGQYFGSPFPPPPAEMPGQYFGSPFPPPPAD